MTKKKTRLFIEAVPLVDRQMSGVPHALAGLVAALARNETIQERFEIVLVAPGSRLHLLERWEGLETCSRRPIPMKFRIMNGLGRRGLLPPMDLLLGSGIYLFGNFFSWPLTRRSRSLTYIHDLCFALYPEYVQPDNQRMLMKNVPRFIRQSDYIITVSQSVQAEIIDYFHLAPDKVLVVYNGVDERHYLRYSQASIEQVKQKYGLAGKDYFIYIGNIEPRKNLKRLVQALQQLSHEQALLVIGSDGWLNDDIHRAIEQARQKGYNIVRPTSYVNDDEVARLTRGAIALILPSLYEGFGMPVLEGMASRVPVIAAAIPSLKEVAGDCAVYCDPADPSSIARAMQMVMAMTKAEKMALLNRESHRSRQFSWSASAAGLASHLEQIAKELG